MVDSERYTVSIEPLDAGAFPALWRQLERRAKPHFFLSSCWVTVWLAAYRPDVQVATIFYHGEVIGLALLTIQRQVRHGVIRSRVLRLGQTGVASEDQIWIEYNDLLLDPAHADTAPRAFMRYLLGRGDWDEFQLGATLAERVQHYQGPGCEPVLKWSAPVYIVDLQAIREQKKPYRAILSRNTRHQINRSERLYQARGKLTFSVITDADEMLQHWQPLACLHQQRWGAEPGQSGFANPDFVRFHQLLIRQGAGQGMVEFCILWLDGEPIGLLYNFVYQGRVYFYLSGIQYESDARCKPGLLLHALAIQHYLDAGYECYDFMGGAAQYKASLGVEDGELQLVSFQRPRLALRLEQLGRKVKSSI